MTGRVEKLPLLEPIRTKGGALMIPIERNSTVTIFIHLERELDFLKHVKSNDNIIDYDKRTWRYISRRTYAHAIVEHLFNPESWKPFR